MAKGATQSSGPVFADPTRLARHYRDVGFFVLRSALVPFATLSEWSEGGEGSRREVAGDWTASEYCEQRALLVERLRQLFARADLAEAVFFASARLSREVERWGAGASNPKLEHTLTRYLLRLAGRETPYGTFAGISLGTVGKATCLRLEPSSSYRRHTRPSMGYVHSVLRDAVRSEDVREACHYFPSSTLTSAFGRYRYTRSDPRDGGDSLMDLEPTPEVDAALARARGGATRRELEQALAPYESAPGEALEFVRSLIEEGVLVPDLFPTVTGHEPFTGLRRSLSAIPSLRPIADRLGEVCSELEDLDRSSLGQHLGQLRELADELASDVASAPPTHVLHADLVKPAASLTIGSDLVRRLTLAAELVQRTGEPPDDARLREFRQRFVERYGSMSVPLAEALDEDLGIGFDRLQQRKDDVLVHELGLRRVLSDRSRSPLDDVRLRLLVAALQRGGIAYELDAESLASFPERIPTSLPESFALVAQLARGSQGLIIVSPGLIAPSGIALLSRFAYADEQLQAALSAHAAAEQVCAGDRVLLDVAHLPGGQIGNILLRPVLREFELPYAGRSGAPTLAQIPLADLHVTVTGERIELFSVRLGKRISVRITNAHNFDGRWNPSLYRFLGALQHADAHGLVTAWSWGALEGSPFLPRVVCQDVVLSRARWRLSPSQLQPLLETDASRAFAGVQALRGELSWPRWLALWEQGRPLVVDLDNPLSVEVLVREGRSQRELLLTEVLPGPEALAVSGPEGGFASEIVVPFISRSYAGGEGAAALQTRSRTTSRVARSFPPGSDWFYAKIYFGASQLHPILRTLAHEVLNVGAAERMAPWFFVPYADPEFHVRLRVWCPEPELQRGLLARLRNALSERMANGAVTRLQLDTYERELERYGGVAGAEFAERVFCHDSEACLELLDLCEDSELRWLLTLGGIERLHDDFQLSREERAALLSSTLEALRAEFAVTTDTLERIGKKYRARQPRIAEVLDKDGSSAGDVRLTAALARARQAWGRRSRGLAALRGRFSGALGPNTWQTERLPVVHAFAHMHAVRMLGTSVRAHELVLYDFLRRHQAMREALRSGARPPLKQASPTSSRG